MFADSQSLDTAEPATDRAATDYRSFRKYRFEQADPTPSRVLDDSDDGPATPHRLALAKARLKDAREAVLSDLSYRPEALAHVRDHVLRLLKIPAAAAPTTPAWWKSVGYGVVGAALPSQVSLAWLRSRLRDIRSFEGRTLVFESSLGALIFPFKYTPTIDYIVRHVGGGTERLSDIEHRSPRWIEALHRLGAGSASELARADASVRGMDGEGRGLVGALVRANVLTSMQEVVRWYQPPDRWSHSRRQYGDEFAGAARAVIAQLLDLGVASQDILQSCQGEVIFRPQRLRQNVLELQNRGILPAGALASAGKLLWMAPTARWVFLLDVLGIRDPAAFGQFAELLGSGWELPIDLARALVSSQASVTQLAACQGVLRHASSLRECAPAVQAWALLHEAGFTVDDFAHAREFLRKPEKLPAFLAELQLHGLGTPPQVLCFDKAFSAVAAPALGGLLDLAIPRQGDQPLRAVADWVGRANVYGVETVRGLVELFGLVKLEELDRVLKFAPLGVPVLSFLVKEKNLRTLRKVSTWYQVDAPGIRGMQLHWPLGAVERLLLNDAFARKNFTNVRHNVHCATRALGRRATAIIGPRPPWDDPAACQAYDARRDVVIERERPQLLHDMKTVLAGTGGVLYASLLAEPNLTSSELASRLASAVPLMDELVAGRGPTSAELTEAELEAVALVYRSDASTVEKHWREVVGHEADIAALKLAPAYPMQWQRTRPELRAEGELDERGFAMLTAIGRQALDYANRSSADLGEAFQGVRPDRLAQRATDVYGFSAHLGVLCCWLAKEPHVRPTLNRWASAQGVLADEVEAYRLIKESQSFFATTLPDALAERLPQLLESTIDDLALSLAAQLGTPAPQAQDTPPKERLRQSLLATLSKAQLLFSAWAKSQFEQFKSVKDDSSLSVLSAIVTKTPAAFYAKTAARLCTSDDTDMWQETRQSHLVVFDTTTRRLAGMAMLYVQPIAAIDRRRDTLVIRAINPMEELASNHDVNSIMDSFLALAIEVAHQNDLAAVALPGGDTHLLSNVNAVEQALIKRRSFNGGEAYPSLSSSSQEGIVDPPKAIEAQFDGYAHEGHVVNSVYMLWRRPEAARGQQQGESR